MDVNMQTCIDICKDVYVFTHTNTNKCTFVDVCVYQRCIATWSNTPLASMGLPESSVSFAAARKRPRACM